MTSQLATLLEAKGRNVHTIAATDSIDAAARSMAQHNVGALLVTDEAGPVGIVTERDVLLRVVALRRSPLATLVAEVMTPNVVVVRPSVTVPEAMAICTHRRLRHLPIVDHGELVGIVSAGDLTRWMVRDRDDHIQELVDYIVGRYPR